MNITSMFTAVAVIGASLLAIEGINLASGGEFYLASIAQLAQETRTFSETMIAPFLPPPTGTQPLPSGELQPVFSPSSSEMMQPSTGSREAVQPPPPPPQGQFLMPQEPTQQQFPSEQPFMPRETMRSAPLQPSRQPQRQQPNGENGHSQDTQMLESISEEDGELQEFVDPREVQQVLRDIKQMRNDIKRNYLKQIKKLGSESDVSQLNEILSDLDRFQNNIGNGSGDAPAIREAIEDFRDGQYWDRLNKIRARIEIPKEIKQITLSVRRLEKTIGVKAAKNLGLNLDRVQQTLAEMKQNIEAVQNHYNSGNFEDAQEVMREFHEGVNPGEIESTIARIREIKSPLKRIKDEAIRVEVERVLQEVVDTFNNGEYRDARETLDEYADDLRNLINKYLVTTGWRRNKPNREESFLKIRNLEGLIKSKLQEKNNSNQGETGSRTPREMPTVERGGRMPIRPSPIPGSPALMPAN